jgi:endonuclease/exonuclease/phosphatase family metal-dependent hydrolase
MVSSDPTNNLRVMTFNTANDFIEPMRLLALLHESKADIVGLEELSPRNAEALQENLLAEYPHRLIQGKRFDGKALLSRHPIERHSFFTLLTPRPYIEAQVMVDGRAVHIFVVHAPAPNYRQMEIRSSAYCEPDIQSLIERGNFDQPTIYMGDFNFIDQSSPYRMMRKAGLTDTFRAAGRGAGLTFPTRFQYLPIKLPLMLRLDYIWTTQHFKPLSSRVGVGYGSDHLPVISELVLGEK